MDTHVPTNLLRMVDTDTTADTGLHNRAVKADAEKYTIHVVFPGSDQKDSALGYGILLDVRLHNGRRHEQHRYLRAGDILGEEHLLRTYLQ